MYIFAEYNYIKRNRNFEYVKYTETLVVLSH